MVREERGRRVIQPSTSRAITNASVANITSRRRPLFAAAMSNRPTAKQCARYRQHAVRSSRNADAASRNVRMGPDFGVMSYARSAFQLMWIITNGAGPSVNLCRVEYAFELRGRVVIVTYLLQFLCRGYLEALICGEAARPSRPEFNGRARGAKGALRRPAGKRLAPSFDKGCSNWRANYTISRRRRLAGRRR